MICPLFGGDCVGVDDCAPAVMERNMINLERPDDPVSAICPVVKISEAVSVAANGLHFLALGTQAKEEENKDDLTDAERRDAVLKELDLGKL